jgi:ABC-type transport system involved in cytochrome bd biosynthesis fused ATPase/permease subunit
MVSMPDGSHRLNVTLPEEYAAKLSLLAQRTHVQEGTLARSLLATALDATDADATTIVALLDGIPEAYERAQLGLERGRQGHAVGLDEL